MTINAMAAPPETIEHGCVDPRVTSDKSGHDGFRRRRLPPRRGADRCSNAGTIWSDDHWYQHVTIAAHNHGGHFIPWELPNEWTDDLRRTLHGHRPA
jgi:hypothetical protein